MPRDLLSDVPGLTADSNPPIQSGKIRFLHLRLHGKEHRIAENEFGISNKGGVTVAYQRSTELTYFRYAFAVCSVKDNFSRYVGRQIAQQYLDDDMEHYVLSTDPAAPNSAFINHNVMKKVVSKLNKLTGYKNLDLLKDLW